MAKDRSLVSASDIGAWAFCQRAWWLAHVKNIPHQNPRVLQKGEATHVAHGRAVVRAYRLRNAGLVLLVVGLILAIIILLLWLWTG
jgi:hypothetical protein